MNKLNIVLGICIVVCVIVSGLLVINAEPIDLYAVSGDVGGLNVNYISHNNTSDTHIEETGDGYAYYFSENSLVNVYLAKEGTNLASKMDYTKSYEIYSPQDINGTMVYLSESNVGDHSGETRYIAFNENRDIGLIIAVSTPYANETAFIMQNLEVVV